MFQQSSIMLCTSGCTLMISFFNSLNIKYCLFIFSYSFWQQFFSFSISAINSLTCLSPISFLQFINFQSKVDSARSSYFFNLATTELNESYLSCRYFLRSTILFSNSTILSLQNCLSYNLICFSISSTALIFWYSSQYVLNFWVNSSVSSSNLLMAARLGPMSLISLSVALLRCRFSLRSSRQCSLLTLSLYKNQILFFCVQLAIRTYSILLTQLSFIQIINKKMTGSHFQPMRLYNQRHFLW